MASSAYSVSQTRQRRAVAGMSDSFVSLDIHPGGRPAGFGTLLGRAAQVAEASQGRFPQPLSMLSGTRPLNGSPTIQNEVTRLRRREARSKGGRLADDQKRGRLELTSGLRDVV